MPEVKAVVTLCDMVTAYGWGVDASWKGLSSGRTAIAPVKRFNTESFQSNSAATIDGLEYHGKDSLVIQMLKTLFAKNRELIPASSKLLLATAKGEVDMLEKELLEGKNDFSQCTLNALLGKVSKLIGIQHAGVVISAACVSSTAALARAAAMIRNKSCDYVLVVACDSVTEFVFSGFSTLMSLDKSYARPFDKKRSGLSLGEAAAYVLVMSQARAKREKREVLGEIVGWGLSNDANHMTGPSRDGSGLVRAIKKAYQMADIDEAAIGSVAAHGTGTLYNDAMEMKAFSTIFAEKYRPVYSIKGGIGHTMGAAGLVEAIMGFISLKERVTPPNINLEDVDDEAKDWVYPSECSLDMNKMALSTNSGFGGVNAALVLSNA